MCIYSPRQEVMKKEISYQRIQSNISKFVNRWKTYTKNERTGAQTFLNEFFEAFGIIFDPNKLPYEFNTGEGFADCYIKGKLILEMKDGNKVKTKEDLLKAIPQAERYWKAQGKEVNYLIISNFKYFVIVDTRDKKTSFIKLVELEAKFNQFSFLFSASTFLVDEQEAVSRNATKIMASIYRSLKTRLSVEKEEEIDTFILQCVFCMFAEDVGFLPNGIFTNLVTKLEEGQFNSGQLLSHLFQMMDEQDDKRKQGSLFESVRWFNGPLFKVKPEIVLTEEEVELLKNACSFDWSHIRPEIFGVLFENSIDESEKSENGMHFTSEEDIMKIVKPCIVDHWDHKFSKCKTQSDFESLHRDLKKYRILDPACGSGNFLLVAYREIKRIESRIFHRLSTLMGKDYSWVQNHMGYYPAQNLYGIEFKKFPTLIARVSLWVTKKMMQIELSLNESDLPLESLNHIICGDALMLKWDDVDVVVGNPPYIGCKKIRKARGDDYFDWLAERFKGHNQMSDYCTYWFDKVFEDVRSGVKVGLVCTKTISQTNSRVASLDKVISNGGEIFNAVSRQKWSGDAQVTVSIVNFVNREKFIGKKLLDTKEVPFISSRLESQDTKSSIEALPLAANENKAFVGVMPNGKGFILDSDEANELIKKDPTSKKVLKLYLNGDDINNNIDQNPSRWIIDFQDWPLEEANKFKAAIAHVKTNVKPVREKVNRERHRQYWWRFGEDRKGLRHAIEGLKQYIVVSRVSKYPIFEMYENKNILPGDSTVSIAFDDYSKMGILQSKFHTDWYKHQCSTLEGRFRYTNTTVFETFPFPAKISDSIGKIMKDIQNYRKQACTNGGCGLTDLYNEMSEGGHQLLKKLHDKLDKEVAKCYEFDGSVESYDKIVKFLMTLNQHQANPLSVKEALEKAESLLEKAVKKSKRTKA